KKTFLLLKALELSDDATKKDLLQWIGKKKFDADQKIEAIKTIYNKLNIKDITINNIESYYQSALDTWNIIDCSKETKAELLNLASMILERDH
ncbi:MAG TPA: hypothetical protein VFG54_11805, partial [Prolixibacteraceae bacterium]|nr:hypothetical protein [Prolixibacteraceae bacterium]